MLLCCFPYPATLAHVQEGGLSVPARGFTAVVCVFSRRGGEGGGEGVEGFGFRVRVYGALTLEFKGLGFRVYRVYAFDVGFTTLGDDIVGGFFLLEVQEPRQLKTRRNRNMHGTL